jgi:hypothetical protein
MNKCSRILPSVLPPCRRIIAIGDIHGDYKVLLKCLYKANVIDKSKKWIGADTIVVQLGDQVDSKCRSFDCEKDSIGEELKIVKYLDNLNEQAQKTGGAVYSLLGNHELMNVMGNFNYVSSEGLMSLGGSSERKNKFAPSGELAIYLACNRNSIMKIGSFLFVHGGLVPKKAKKYTLEKINELIREYLLGNINGNTRELNDLLQSRESPFWDRTFSNRSSNEPKTCSVLNETIQYLKLRGMVVGHSVQRGGINSGCDGKIWRTDIGMSKSFGKRNKKIQVLEILNDGKEVNIIK